MLTINDWLHECFKANVFVSSMGSALEIGISTTWYFFLIEMTECWWEEILWGGELFGAVHFRVLNTALQMNYQHNFTCRLLRDWRHWSNWKKKHLFLAHGLRAQSIVCVRWRRQDDEKDALVAPWGTWWSHCVLRHEAERGVQLAFSFWTFKKVF